MEYSSPIIRGNIDSNESNFICSTDLWNDNSVFADLDEFCLESNTIQEFDCQTNERRNSNNSEAAMDESDKLPLTSDSNENSFTCYDIQLRIINGTSLAVRDRNGTSDPYVIVKRLNQILYKTKYIKASLNPIWNETFSTQIAHLSAPIEFEVFDKDFLSKDDFMGRARLELISSMVDQGEMTVKLPLEDVQAKEDNLGSIFIAVDCRLSAEENQTLVKTSTEDSWSLKLEENEVDLVSYYEINVKINNGIGLSIKDRSGTSDPYVIAKYKNRILYKTKVIKACLDPVWNESFSLNTHNLNEPMIFSLFDKDWLSRDDFMGSAQLNLNTVPIDSGASSFELPLRGSKKPLGSLAISVEMKSISEMADITVFNGVCHIVIQATPAFVNCLSYEDNFFLKVTFGKQTARSPNFAYNGQTFNEEVDFTMDGEYFLVELTMHSKINKDIIPEEKYSIFLCDYCMERTHRVYTRLANVKLKIYFTVTATNLLKIDSPPEVYPSMDYSFFNAYYRKEVGLLHVNVIGCEDIPTNEMSGRTEPFFVMELGNEYLRTQPIRKKNSHITNKHYEFRVWDIHENLILSVHNKDRLGVDFLGRVCIPLISIKNLETVSYFLKTRKMLARKKGRVILKLHFTYNLYKAVLNSLIPKEEKVFQHSLYRPETEDNNIRRVIGLYRNLSFIGKRAKAVIESIKFCNNYIVKILNWENPPQTIFAFFFFLLIVYYFEIYMLPIGFIILLLPGIFKPHDDNELRMGLKSEEDLNLNEDAANRNNNGWNTLYSLLEGVDEVVSFLERTKNLFHGCSPFVSVVFMVLSLLVSLVLYFIPLRLLVLLCGIRKFTKHLMQPHIMSNNEVVDLISRVPSDMDKEIASVYDHDTPKKKKSSQS